jgi:hypothetical protein
MKHNEMELKGFHGLGASAIRAGIIDNVIVFKILLFKKYLNLKIM